MTTQPETKTLGELVAGAHAALDWAFTQAKARAAVWEPAPCPPQPRSYWKGDAA